MKIKARINIQEDTLGPDPWDEKYLLNPPKNHIICRDVDGTPHTIYELIWPWTAYNSRRKKCLIHFLYWKGNSNKIVVDENELSPDRLDRTKELQILMARHVYYGDMISTKSMTSKLYVLHSLARFAEEKSCSVFYVMTHPSLIKSFTESLAISALSDWLIMHKFFMALSLRNQLGFSLAEPSHWNKFEKKAKEYRKNRRQFAPLPTRIYAALINNISAEIDDIEKHKTALISALKEASSISTKKGFNRADFLFSKYGLKPYLQRRGFDSTRIRGLSGALREIFVICKLQIHLFSGMRDEEALYLPYHCATVEEGLHGRKHFLISGITTKLNNGNRTRTKWITTEGEGFRAIKLAQEFANTIYGIIDVSPSTSDDLLDDYPLFPSTSYLPWMPDRIESRDYIARTKIQLAYFNKETTLLSRLCPIIEEQDIEELEQIDPFRAWEEEPEFKVGQRWPLTTHQLRRSLAVYANASGLVRLSSLRRQLQHITREMSMYYGRGSTFCKNFIGADPAGFKKHVAIDWQDGAEEAEMLAFVRDVLNAEEAMFGGGGAFYERQRERGEVMSREEVGKQMKSGLLAYREGPLGGCTRPGICETRKGLQLIDTTCATDGCRYLIGKHSKIIQTIHLKRAAMANILPGSITEAMEREDLAALERVELAWRQQEHSKIL